MSEVSSTPDGLEIKRLKGTRPLKDALYLSGPFEVQDAPNAYSFTRSNKVSLDWSKVLASVGMAPPTTYSGQLKLYVERSWHLVGAIPTAAEIGANAFDLGADWPAYVLDGASVSNAVATGIDAPTIFKGALRAHRRAPFAEKVIPLEKGSVLRVPTANGDRWYQPVGRNGAGVAYPALAEFTANWDAAWANVTALVQVYHPGAKPAAPADAQRVGGEAQARAKVDFPAVETIRADAATIRREYRALMNEVELADRMSDKATALANLIPMSQPDLIPSIAAQFRDLKNFGSELDGRKRQLADAAADLNYTLITAPTTIHAYDGSGAAVDVPLTEGELYVKTTRTVSWTTYQTMTAHNDGFFGIGASDYSWQRPIKHTKTFDYLEKATVDYDPWIEVLDLYKSAGYQTYLFRFSDQGLISADGSRPTQVIQLCEEDESFRRRCVIALPIKEISITGETFVIGYNLFIRPVPDIVATSYPEFSLRERLSYRFAWTGVALGDLAATIPLSPGEQREVTLKTTQKYTSTRSETASSLIDVTRIDKADFETVFEKEVRKENETSTTAGGSLSGSYAGVSGSANFSKTSSTKEVARQLNRSVARASQEVNRRSKEEKTVSVSETVETSSENATTFKVRNINDGSTLNIAFYRLMNAYESVLRLDDFQYAIRAGRSIMASTDLVDEVVFEREAILTMVSWLKAEGRFPVNISHLSEAETLKFAAAIHEQILKAYEGYKDEEPQKKKALLSAELAREGEAYRKPFLALSERFGKFAATLVGAEAVAGESQVTLQLMRRAYQDIISDKSAAEDEIIGLPFWNEKTTFAYDSGSLYVDVYVGQRPATEPYSENMRRLEEKRVSGENRLVLARARYLEARAARQLLGLGEMIDPRKAYLSEADVLFMDDGHVLLKLRIVPALLSTGGWSAVIRSSGDFHGGVFLQEDSSVEGVATFLLPRRFREGSNDISQKDIAWYRQNVSAKNEDFNLTLSFRPA